MTRGPWRVEYLARGGRWCPASGWLPRRREAVAWMWKLARRHPQTALRVVARRETEERER